MSKLSKHPGIVVGVDGSPGSIGAVQWAARAAELRNVSLTLVHVVPPTAGAWLESSLLPAWMHAQRERGAKCSTMPSTVAQEAASAARRNPLRNALGNFGWRPCRSVQRRRSHRYGLPRYRHAAGPSSGFGESGLVYHARCPVAIIHDGVPLTSDTAAPVLLGIDGSPESETATAIAFDEASRRKVGLVALHAWSDVSVFDSVADMHGPRWPH